LRRQAFVAAGSFRDRYVTQRLLDLMDRKTAR
jgi:hypothetical protein